MFTSTLLHLASIPPAGQRFILSLPQRTSNAYLKNWLAQTKPAGIMLLASHCEDRKKAKQLISFLQQEAKKLGLPPLLITIDWEGGIISRPSEAGGFTSAPSPWLLAQAGRNSCYLAGMLIGSQMHSIGAHMDFAPSLDLFDPNNCVLGTRCYSADTATVAECGIAFASGLISQGIIPVIKHFPGLGLGKKDTHCTSVGIKVDEKTLQTHMQPFLTALDNTIPCIMCTHAIYKQFDNKPATLSSKPIGLLSAHNPNTLFITDDFAMKAVQEGRTLEDSILESFNAGYHLIIFCDVPNKQINLIKHVEKKLEDLSPEQLISHEQKCNQINAFKQMYITAQTHGIISFDEKTLADYLAKRCLTAPINHPLLEKQDIIMISVNLPKIRPSEQWFVHNGKSTTNNLLSIHCNSITEYLLNACDKSSITQLKTIMKSITHNKNPIIVQTFFYADSIWNTMQLQWLKLLKPLHNRLIIFSLGHPLEQKIIQGAYIFNLGSFNQPLLTRAVHTLCTKQQETGADKFADQFEHYLDNKKIGLLCHKASMIAIDGTSTFLPDALYAWTKKQHNNTQLVALFSPEHGLQGTAQAGAHVGSAKTSPWGCPVYSLHGKSFKPMPSMLEDLDVIVIDLQEVGVRCFTYLSTLLLMLEAAREVDIQVIVLDRPNPLKLWGQTGPLLKKKYESFLGKLYIPFLHGSTIGQLAQQINQTIRADLTVIGCPDCDADLFFERAFIPPSPNLASIDHIYAYPLTVFIEGTNYSEGRGTAYPFLQIGAPWVDKQLLATTLNQKGLPGIYFEPISFTPRSLPGIADNPKHVGKNCGGVFIHIFDAKQVQPIKTAQTILTTLFKLYPAQSQLLPSGTRYTLDLLVGDNTWRIKLNKIKQSFLIQNNRTR
jgi:uncharacterized protein YbbC (DUF1343 family)/beta-glucosidase-like glycosyl hydrolase